MTEARGCNRATTICELVRRQSLRYSDDEAAESKIVDREKVRQKLCKASRRLGGSGFLVKTVMIGGGVTLGTLLITC